MCHWGKRIFRGKAFIWLLVFRLNMQESPSDTKNMANALARVCEGHVSELSGAGRVHIWREARHDSSTVLLNLHRTSSAFKEAWTSFYLHQRVFSENELLGCFVASWLLLITEAVHTMSGHVWDNETFFPLKYRKSHCIAFTDRHFIF